MAWEHDAGLDVVEAAERGHGLIAVLVRAARLQLRIGEPAGERADGAKQVADEDNLVFGELERTAAVGVARHVSHLRMARYLKYAAVGDRGGVRHGRGAQGSMADGMPQKCDHGRVVGVVD